ncbi:MAG: hypothetical protein WCY19_03010 [Candidatus Gastranaerophilaceae bacterium]
MQIQRINSQNFNQNMHFGSFRVDEKQVREVEKAFETIFGRSADKKPIYRLSDKVFAIALKQYIVPEKPLFSEVGFMNFYKKMGFEDNGRGKEIFLSENESKLFDVALLNHCQDWESRYRSINSNNSYSLNMSDKACDSSRNILIKVFNEFVDKAVDLTPKMQKKILEFEKTLEEERNNIAELLAIKN